MTLREKEMSDFIKVCAGVYDRVGIAERALEIACTVRTQNGDQAAFSAELYNAYRSEAEKELADERRKRYGL